MTLIYKGDGTAHINEIPARDLSDTEINEMLNNGVASRVCGRDVSLAEFEGMLIKGKLYAMAPKVNTKTEKKVEE